MGISINRIYEKSHCTLSQMIVFHAFHSTVLLFIHQPCNPEYVGLIETDKICSQINLNIAHRYTINSVCLG